MLKRFKDFLSIKESKEIKGYLGVDSLKDVKPLTIILHTYISESLGNYYDEEYWLFYSDENKFSLYACWDDIENAKRMVEDPEMEKEENYELDGTGAILYFHKDDMIMDENGIAFKDTIHGGISYLKFKDSKRNDEEILKSGKGLGKFQL